MFKYMFIQIDAVPCDFAIEWMVDFESYLTALDSDNTEEYMTSMNRSLALVLDEFYKNIKAVGVSAATGEGMDALFEKVRYLWYLFYLKDLLYIYIVARYPKRI